MKPEIALKEISWEKWLPFGVLMVLLYYSTYAWLISKDWSREDYSYGYLIPFVFTYLVWEKRKAFANVSASTTWLGLIPVLIGVCLYWVGELAGEIFSIYLSSWLIFSGVLLILFGWQKIKQIGFALSMLIFMFPLPHFVNNKVTFQLKLISSKLGVWMLQAYGISAYREGNVIDLGFTQLQVVDACSGLRYTLPLLIMGLLLTYLSKMQLWKKAVVVVSTVPFSVVVNGLRIASVGILYQYWGPTVAEGFFHDFSGWFIFMTSLIILLGEMAFLKRIGVSKARKIERITQNKKEKQNDTTHDQGYRESSITNSGSSIKHPAPNLSDQHAKGIATILKPPQFLSAMALLAITLVLTQGIEFREKVPIAKSLEEFPMSIGSWQGYPKKMEQKFIDELDLSDYLIADFNDTNGKQVNFYVAYYQSQRKGEAIHSPDTCLPGSGWTFSQSGKIDAPLRQGTAGTLPVRRALMQNGSVRQLAYFWFPMRGRTLTSAWEMKLYNFWDALTRQRTDGAWYG
ncbi:exosortase C-terminal domain/associated protein EpsI [Desulfosarcina cetonica]|uniref:exosortase C-terminal domain/associated protein EpsI n=1 Tax=Desulfosarcina cetonica TaxID=90730 RepID=UPI0006D07206|nr:EpsI domain-containing exosortase [Desulfosarcina cetonica]